MTPDELEARNQVLRVHLDEQLRSPIRVALEAGLPKQEVLYLLTRMLPELGELPGALGHVLGAYAVLGGDDRQRARDMIEWLGGVDYFPSGD